MAVSKRANLIDVIVNPTKKVIMKVFELGHIDCVDSDVLLRQSKKFLEKLNRLKTIKDVL